MSEHIRPNPSTVPRHRIDTGTELKHQPDARRDDDTVEYDLSPELIRELDARFEFLPTGFAVIGGAARQIAMEQLTGRQLSLRDEDIIFFEDMADAEDSGDAVLMDELSEQYMPEDYASGHGVGRSASIAEYMESRDLTINQLAVVRTQDSWRLHMSNQAALDLPRGVIRPTIAAHNNDYYLHDKLAIKAILLETVLQELDGIEEASIKGIDIRRYAKEYDINDFHIALGM